MDGQDWIVPMSRKEKRRMRGTAQEKEIQALNTQEKYGAKSASTSPLAGEEGQMTPTFPRDGQPSQQILVQVLATLLQQAGLAQ